MSELFYNLRLIHKSFRRDMWFTLVMVVSQALSVSIFVTALVTAQRYSNVGGQLAGDVYRVEGEKNEILSRFYRGSQFEGFGEFTGNYVSLPTVHALSATGIAAADSVSFIAGMTGGPTDRAPGRLAVRFCNADFFDLFMPEFRYGGPFTRADERAVPPVPSVVLSDVLNISMFGGDNSVGRIIRIAGRDFRVAGVMRQRTGKLHIWDFGIPPENITYLIAPFAFANELRPVPWITWPPSQADPGWKATAASPAGITEYWVRLPTAEARARFAAAIARVDPRLTLRSSDDITRRFAKAPAPYRVFVILTLVVLEVSVINLMRMLLAKATSRAAEIGIHRALGAGRNIIFARQLAEGTIVSMVGSVWGLVLAIPTVRVFDRLVPDSPVRLGITPTTVCIALGICLVGALIAGIYPAWRIASVAPTRYLGKV